MDSKPPHVRVTPEAETWLTIDPGMKDGATEASIHRAKVAQRAEREAAIDHAIVTEGLNLLTQQCLDSNAAERVAKALPTDLALQDRRDAAAVAVRLHDPRWQIVSRYEAADAILVALRSSQRAHGWYLADSDLRQLADHLAAVSHRARLKVWTGQVMVTARTWTKAALGFLSVTEDR